MTDYNRVSIMFVTERRWAGTNEERNATMITETCNTFGSSLDRYDYDTTCEHCGEEARYDADDPCCDDMAVAIQRDEAERIAAIREAVAYERMNVDGVTILESRHVDAFDDDNPPY